MMGLKNVPEMLSGASGLSILPAPYLVEVLGKEGDKGVV